jgi:hypothetical protein
MQRRGSDARNVLIELSAPPPVLVSPHSDTQGVLLNKTEAFFGSFRRCNYPRLGAEGNVEIVMECGRYSR